MKIWDTLIHVPQDLLRRGYVLIDKIIGKQDLYENPRYLLEDPL